MADLNKNTSVPQWLQTVVTGSTLIFDCDLSIRLKKIFKNAGFTYVSDILEYDYVTLSRFRGLGEKSTRELIEFMSINNLCFNN